MTNESDKPSAKSVEAVGDGSGNESMALSHTSLHHKSVEAVGDVSDSISSKASPSDSFPPSWSWRDGPCQPGLAVVADVDGVISDAAGRQHFLNEPPKDWRGFFNACDQDPPIPSTIEMLRQLRPELLVILLTARPSWVRDRTMEWLKRQDLRWDLLVLRSPEEDTLSAGDYKLASLKELQNRGFELVLGFEDDPKNVQIFRDFGLPCVYIHSGYYEHRKGRSPIG